MSFDPVELPVVREHGPDQIQRYELREIARIEGRAGSPVHLSGAEVEVAQFRANWLENMLLEVGGKELINLWEVDIGLRSSGLELRYDLKAEGLEIRQHYGSSDTTFCMCLTVR